MAQPIDLEGLPEPVAKAIAETVHNLKNRYGVPARPAQKTRDLPSRPGKVIGSLRRVDIYDERAAGAR
jgi:hypothetical protein